MGLDMYLKATKYASNYGTDGKRLFQKIVKAADAESFVSDDGSGMAIEIPVAYWRKANHIHQWFVKNVQESVDECQEAFVTRDQLKELLVQCEAVRDNHNLAESLLPTTSGFFFGDTEYDEWYFNSIDYTIEALSRVLNNVPDSWGIYYRSSW